MPLYKTITVNQDIKVYVWRVDETEEVLAKPVVFTIYTKLITYYTARAFVLQFGTFNPDRVLHGDREVHKSDDVTSRKREESERHAAE